MSAAMVTGGAKRIGAAIVRRLVAEGMGVAIHCNRSRGEAEALAADIRSAGGRAAILVAELSDPAAVGRLVGEASAALGPLSLLVNNASVFEAEYLTTFAPERFDRHMAVNLRAPLQLARTFAAQAPEGSAIINIIDQRVLKPTPQYLSYALSKSALWMATRMLAQELAPAIRVNAVAPGPSIANVMDGEGGFQREAAATPLARPVDPAEIADAVAWLARARSVTGQMIAVDSGQHLAWRTPDVVAVEEG